MVRGRMRPPARHLLMAAALELVWLGCAAPEKTAPCPSMALPPPYALAAVQAPNARPAPKATTDGAVEDSPEQIEDDVDPNEQRQEATGHAVEHPLLRLSDDELAKRFESQPATLGSLSIGRPGGGSLVNGVQMPEG